MLPLISKIKDIFSNKYVKVITITTLSLLTISLYTLTYIHFFVPSNDANTQEPNTNQQEEVIEEEKSEEINSQLEQKDSQEEINIVEEVQDEKKTTTSTTTKEDTKVEPERTPEETTPEETEPEPEVLTATVAFYADNQSDTDAEDLNHQRVVNYILSSGANPIFHAGDLMEDGTQDSLDRFNSVTQTLRSTRTFYAALGNNDRKVGDSTTPSQLFLDNFTFPNNEKWYSVNYGNLHMVVLDSAFSAGSTTQLNWLSSDLQSASSQDRITGIMFHHPTFASTISSYIANYGVDFVISGHIHSYTHTISNGVDHFTLSGQPNIGYIKARIYTNHVEMTAYNSANGIIEKVEFENR